MAFECEHLARNLRKISGSLGIEISRLGCGGDGKVCLHELKRDGVVTKVAVKSVSRQDALWQK